MAPQGIDVQELAVNTGARGERAGVVAGRPPPRLRGRLDVRLRRRQRTPSSTPPTRRARALRRLTRTAELEAAPSWSPDGRRLVYAVVSGLETDTPRSEIWVVNADGSGRQRLSAAGASDHNPSWSPDGARIAFSSDRSGAREIYTMSTRGTDVRRLTVDRDQDDHPSWSPDGRRLVWVSDLETFTGSELYAADSATGATGSG